MEIWLFWAIAGAITLGVAAILVQALRQGEASRK